MAIEDESAQDRDRGYVPGKGAFGTLRHVDKEGRAASNERRLGDGQPREA